MSAQPQTAVEEFRLNLLPGSGEEENKLNHTISAAVPCCTDRNHRNLAICSVICGLSCIGFKALIYSAKVLQNAFSSARKVAVNPSFDAHVTTFMHLVLVDRLKRRRIRSGLQSFRSELRSLASSPSCYGSLSWPPSPS